MCYVIFFVLYCLYSTIALLSLPFLCMNKIIVGVVVVFFVTVFFYFSVEYFKTF